MKLLRVAGVLLAVGAVAAGCGHRAASSPAPAAPPKAVPASTIPTSSAPAGGPEGTPLTRTSVGSGSDGLTVRYADRDGSIKTLRVEDFRR